MKPQQPTQQHVVSKTNKFMNVKYAMWSQSRKSVNILDVYQTSTQKVTMLKSINLTKNAIIYFAQYFI